MKKEIAANITGLMERIGVAKAAISEVGELDRALREQHQEAVLERERILSRPGPRTEIIKAMRAAVDQLGRAWRDDFESGLIQSFGGGFILRADGQLMGRQTDFPDWAYGPGLSFAHLCGFFSEEVKTGLERVIAGVKYEEGPAAARRLELLAEADERIGKIEAEHISLSESAAALTPPISITLLPVVAERRRAEQYAIEQDRQRAEANDAAAAELDERVKRSGRRVIRSPYLEREQSRPPRE